MTHHPSGDNPYAAPQIQIVYAGGDLAPASRWKRLAGTLLDGVVVALVFFPIVIAVYGSFENYGQSVGEGGFLSEVAWQIFSIIVYVALNGYLLATRGQSIGKIVMKTRIVRGDGTPADFVRLVAVRYVPFSAIYLIPFVGPVLALINALLIFRESHKCGHDEIADTIVVDAR